MKTLLELPDYIQTENQVELKDIISDKKIFCDLSIEKIVLKHYFPILINYRAFLIRSFTINDIKMKIEEFENCYLITEVTE